MEQRLELRVRAGPSDINKSFDFRGNYSNLLVPVSLRGGMIDDDTRTPSLFSRDLEDDNHVSNPGTRSPSLCSGDMPDSDPNENTAIGVLTQLGMTRGVTPVTFVDRTQTGTVLIPEPDQLHIPRQIAEEDAERAGGTIATPTTPVLKPMDSPRANDQDLAEYVDHRFGLDGTGSQIDMQEGSENPGVTFRVPVYHRNSDIDDTGVFEEAVGTEAALNPTISRRISTALQDVRSRISTFFPITDIVTSRRNSTAPSMSRRSRASITLQHALGEQTLLAKAVNRLIPGTSDDQPSARGDVLPQDGASDTREEESRADFAESQTLPARTAVSRQTNMVDRRVSEPIMSQHSRDASALSNIHSRRSLSGAGERATNNAPPLKETQKRTESPSILQRTWHRLSTTLTSSSRFGSYDGTSAPPPTREERPVSECYRSVDAEAVQPEQKPSARTSRASTRLRHIGSSTLNLARRGLSIFSALPEPGRDLRDISATDSPVRDYAEHTVASNARMPDNLRGSNKAETTPSSIEETQVTSRRRRRGLIRSEWRQSMRVASAPFRRQHTPFASAAPPQAGHGFNAEECENKDSQVVPAGSNANRDMDNTHGEQVTSRTEEPLTDARQFGDNPQRDVTWAKSAFNSARRWRRSEQNVIPL